METSLVAQRPSRSDLLLLAGYWLVVGPVLLVQYRADTGAAVGHLLPLLAGTVALDTVAALAVVGGLLPLLLQGRLGWGLALLAAFIALSGSSYLLLYGWLLGHVRTWSGGQVLLGAVAHAKSYGLLAVLLTGKRYYETQQRVLRLQHAQVESELRALRAQLDPHFLFNNLHVLQVLIGQDAAVAEEFLHRFAGLYRYLLRHRDADFVTLTEELAFLDEYVYLLRHRFGTAYQFSTVLSAGLDATRLHVVPGTVQLLLENAIKHNRGDEDEPLHIAVVADADSLLVCNPRRPKHRPAEPGGLGLPNLRRRYRLLTGTEVQVTATDTTFEVRVPLLRQLAAPQPLP